VQSCSAHTFTHVEPTQATGRPRHTVQSCSAQAGRFLRIFPGRAAALCRPRLRQTCEKTAWRRLKTPASATGAARTLSRRQCARRLPKNEGYKASPRSALSADGEANKGTRSADPPARHRGRRRGLAQRPARHGRAQRPRKSGSPAGTRRHRGLCLGSGRHRPRATTPCPRIMSYLILPHPYEGEVQVIVGLPWDASPMRFGDRFIYMQDPTYASESYADSRVPF